MLAIRLFALIASMKLARRWKRGLTMTDHKENQKLWELDCAIHGGDKAKGYWEWTDLDMDDGRWYGSSGPCWNAPGLKYRRKSDAPKLPDGDCRACGYVKLDNKEEHYDIFTGKTRTTLPRVIGSKDEDVCAACRDYLNVRSPNPQQSFVLCWDCEYVPDFSTTITPYESCPKGYNIKVVGVDKHTQA
jgi:hypothetical protein